MVIPIETSSLPGVVLVGVFALILSFAGLRAVLLVPAWHQPPTNTSPASVVGNETCIRVIGPT